MTSKGKLAQDWLLVMYQEAWKQLTHEDEIMQSRNTLYLSMQAALIAIIAATTNPLLSVSVISVQGTEVFLGTKIFGIFLLIVAILGISLSENWETITNAGEVYLLLRRDQIRLIEKYCELNPINLAEMEHLWQLHSEKTPESLFYPIEAKPYKDFAIRPLRHKEGFSTLRGVIQLAKVIWLVILVTGVVLVLI